MMIRDGDAGLRVDGGGGAVAISRRRSGRFALCDD
jgi:hypothetical protein